MSKQLVLVEKDALDALFAEVRRLSRKLDGATVQPRSEWVSIPEAAEILQIRPDSVQRKARKGELETRGKGRGRMVRLV